MDFVATVGDRIVGEVRGRSLNAPPTSVPAPSGPKFPPNPAPEVFVEVASVEVTNPFDNAWLIRVHTEEDVAGFDPIQTGDPWRIYDATGLRTDFYYTYETPRNSLAFVLDDGTVSLPVRVVIPPSAHQFFNRNCNRIRPGAYTSA